MKVLEYFFFNMEGKATKHIAPLKILIILKEMFVADWRRFQMKNCY